MTIAPRTVSPLPSSASPHLLRSMLPTCPTPCADHCPPPLHGTHARISPTISSPGLCRTRKRETRAGSGGLRREAENA